MQRAFSQIASSIQQTSLFLERLSVGNFDSPPAPVSEHDTLGQACHMLSDSLETLVRSAIDIASGKDSIELPEEDSSNRFIGLLCKWADMRRILNEMGWQGAQLATLSDSLIRDIAMITEKMEDIARQVSAISINSQQVFDSAQTMANASREMASSTHEIAMNTPELEQVAGDAVERVTSANDVIESLKTHSEEIGDIIQLITDVSQQTNLLALNATIEAARAGEAGRGFAVVANEIKNLSRETADSTEHIINRLEAIKSSSEKVQEVIDDVSLP
jgi:methyl-accepting chemotaxis protein